MNLSLAWPLTLLVLAFPGQAAPQESREVTKADRRKTCEEYLTHFRRITWYYDHATATELARETGRPMFVIFCRAGTLLDPMTRKPKAAS